jgi:hypothetical protein
VELGTVAHACNSNYLGYRVWENCGSGPAQVKKKKITETPMSTNKSGMVAHACSPSYTGGIGRRMKA